MFSIEIKMKNGWPVMLIVAVLAAIADTLAAAVDPRAWTELDLVPMPKSITLTDRALTLAPDKMVLALGANPCRQAEIGADWINRRIKELNGQPLPIVTTRQIPANCAALLIGCQSDNPLVKEAVRNGTLDLGPDHPGPRGYVIRARADGAGVFLAGADAIGALYACVTFAELMQKRGGDIVWRGADVRDWPDIIHMTMGGDYTGSSAIPEIAELFSALRHNPQPDAGLRGRYLAAMQSLHDWMLRRKITSMSYALGHLQGRRMTPRGGDGGEVIREAIAYGRERGIGALVYAVNPFVGRAEIYPELKADALPPGRYPDWIRSWSMDGVRRETAGNLARLMGHYGITDIGFHDSDAGGVKNPAQWNDRPEQDRQRWGDDYAAATAHIHRQYYDAIKALHPEMRLHFTIYPYVVEVLDEETGEWYLRQPYAGGATGPGVRELARANKERYEVFWKRLHAMVPPDVSFCVRETKSAPMEKFRAIIHGRPAFIFFGLQSPSFLAEYARSAGMFYHDHDDFIFLTFADKFVPVNSLAVREYSWNANAPGAAPFGESAPTRDLHAVILPRIIRNIFGPALAPEIFAAVSEPITPDRIDAIKDAAGLQEQAAMAERGAQALDRAWTKITAHGDRQGMDDFAFRRLVNLREVYHTSQWRARIRAQVVRARELALQREAGAARAAIQAAGNLLGEARSGLDRLIKERPPDPVLDRDDQGRWSGNWRANMADRVDLAALEKQILDTQSELGELAARGSIPPAIMERLSNRQGIRVAPAGASIELDGRMNEPAWSQAPPVECFLLVSADGIVARADTRARFLYDTKTLYIGVNAWTPDQSPPDGKDLLELFVCAPGLNQDYIHLFFNASGKVRCQYLAHNPVAGATAPPRNWPCPGLASAVHQGADQWSLEAGIPMASLQSQPGDGWRVNLLRVCPTPNGRESSMILPPGVQNAHATDRFVPLSWDDRSAYAPECRMAVAGLESGAVTVRDRIGGYLRFGLAMDCNQVLRNVAVSAEVRDQSNRSLAAKALMTLPVLYFHYAFDDPLTVELPEESPAGRVIIQLTADEGHFTYVKNY